MGELRRQVTSNQWPRFSIYAIGQILRDCDILSDGEFTWLVGSGVPFFDGDPPWINRPEAGEEAD